jgi:hypothetical protein
VSLARRLRDAAIDVYNDIADEFNTRHGAAYPQPSQYRSSPNSHPEVTPAPVRQSSVGGSLAQSRGPSVGPSPLPGGGSLSNNVVLNGSGAGTAFIGPTRPNEHWQLLGATASLPVASAQGSVSLYVGSSVANGILVGTTQYTTLSPTAVFGLGNMDIQPGQQVWAVWTGGPANTTATLLVAGTYTIGAPTP